MRSHRYLQSCFAAAVLVFLSTSILHALTFPQLSGRVVDDAGILDPATVQTLTDRLAAAEARTGNQIVVVTLKSLQETSIADFGVQLGRAWGIGSKDKNNGALLIVVPSEKKVRIEVGYGLEGSLTDAVTKLIIQNAIVPRFRAGDFPGGILRGVDDIVQVVSGDADEFKRQAAQRPDSGPEINVVTIVIFLIVIFFLMRTLRSSGGGALARGRGGFAGPIFIPSGGSSSSGWGGGGGSGGFSGGGGSFGGGGSSGDW